MNHITIKLSQSDLKRSALAEQGIAPVAYGQRKASQPHKNRRELERRGQFKHKGRVAFD
jgi:hypothetical protein